MRRLLASALREDAGGTYSGLESDGDLASLPLRAGRLVFRIAGTHAFRRVEVGDEVAFVGDHGSAPVGRASDLIPHLEARTDPHGELAWEGLLRELENGAANLALARAFSEREMRRLRALAGRLGAADSLELAARLAAREDGFDAALFFERLCVEGHNLHPSAKTRLGMEPAAVFRHAPEMGGAADLRFAAVRRDLALSAGVDGGDFQDALLSRLPQLRGRAEQELSGRGLRPEDYVLAPVHPWQFGGVLPGLYAGEVSRREVVPLEGVRVPARATASFRTVVPEGANIAVKTAVSSQMTSTVRSISPQTAANAPEFTRVIRAVMRRERTLAGTFIPVCELAGFSFAGDTEEKRRALSSVLREGIEGHVGQGELAIPGCALYAQSPVTGKTLLAELLEAYSRTTGAASPGEAALGFISEYAGVSVPGTLTLMSVYGIGLEGHLQNAVPVFRGGRPTKMLFRDWGGARVHAGRLKGRGIQARFAPGSLTLTKDTKELRRKVFYTVFQNHLGEVVLQAAKHADVPERNLWRVIKEVCDATFEKLDGRGCSEALADREALYAPRTPHKALALMRLKPSEGDIYVKVSNPLHGV